MNKTRKTLLGKKLTSLSENKEIIIKTKCTNKWFFIDIEDGNIWKWRNNTWESATVTDLKELKKVIATENNIIKAMCLFVISVVTIRKRINIIKKEYVK